MGELNFNIIAVGSGVLREVILNNTSKCPVTYDIVLPSQYQPDPDAPQPPAKVKDNRLVGHNLDLSVECTLASLCDQIEETVLERLASSDPSPTFSFVLAGVLP